MVFFLTFFIGIILVIGIIFYLIFGYTNKKTFAVRSQILSGTKTFLAHWKYDNINIADYQPFGSGLTLYKKKLADVKEIYICSDGILFGDVVFYSWNRLATFKKLEIKAGNPFSIHFKIEYGSGDSETINEFYIPIPEEKELEAKSVVDTLSGFVQFDR